MTTEATQPLRLSTEQLQELLAASRGGDFQDRRAAERHAFFAPVSIIAPTAHSLLLSAFSRDVSQDGIGLLHFFRMEPGAMCELCIGQSDVKIRLRAEVMWTKPAGEGWFTSGWRFVD